MLKGKKILLGITGSIAAYKAILLVRLFVKAGAEVKVVMTPAARDFVSPLTLSTLSKNPVVIDLFEGHSWSNHVMLGRWADLMLIAPASVNTIAKMAQGSCDNLLLAAYLSATCPVCIAPAMDEDMWKHPATQRNLETLKGFGHLVIPVAEGELASGLTGPGRMAEPDAILAFMESHFFSSRELEGKRALVTAGPTYEPIDPVRFIGNHSSGKMGIALAHELQCRGADVDLVLGPGVSVPVAAGIRVVRVNTAAEMLQACLERFPGTELTIMAAAVADYTPQDPAAEKVKKTGDHLSIELRKTTDILRELGQQKKAGQVLVGFALETQNERDYALSKLEQKNADLIVLNSLRDAGAGFGTDTNKVTLFGKNGFERAYETRTKQQVARDIVDTLVNLFYA